MIDLRITGPADVVLRELDALYHKYCGPNHDIDLVNKPGVVSMECTEDPTPENVPLKAKVSCPVPEPRKEEDYEIVAEEAGVPVALEEFPELPPLPDEIPPLSVVPQPSNPAPTAPPPPAPAASEDPLVPKTDADGYPWDPRIDGPAKDFVVKTGLWKKKRGIASTPQGKATLARVRAEQKQAGYPISLVKSIRPPAPPPAPAAPAAPQAPDALPKLTFNRIVAAITNKVNLKEITNEVVDSYLSGLGVPFPYLPMLCTKEALFPEVVEYFGLC